MNRDFIGALLQLNAEKGVPQEILIRTLEQAIESAYRRNADAPENVVVTVNPESGEISVAREYEVVAGEQEIEDPELQMTAAAAQKIDAMVAAGQPLPPLAGLCTHAEAAKPGLNSIENTQRPGTRPWADCPHHSLF